MDNITPATSAGFEANLATNLTGGSKAASLNRPNVVFSGQLACLSAADTINVIVNTAPSFDITNNVTICNNSVQSIVVSTPATNYNQVTWSPINNLFVDAAATIPYTANTHATQVYYKSNVSGVSKYLATAYNSATSCGSLDSIKITNLPATVTVTGNKSYVCGSGSSTFSITPNLSSYNVTYQWQSSSDNINFTNITGATNAIFTSPTVTATTFYRVLISNGSSTCITSLADTINVENPNIIAVVNGTRCGNGIVNLSANAGSYAVEWYDNATGGNPIFYR